MSLANNQIVYYDQGNTYIHNELLEKLARTDLNSVEHDILFILIRYAYNDKSDHSSLSEEFIFKKLEQSQQLFKESIKKLIRSNILTPVGAADQQSSLKINEDFNEWYYEGEEKKRHNKKNRNYDEDSTYYKMAKHFYDLVTPVAEEAGVSHLIAKANLQSWADDFRKLWEKDKVQDKQQILAVMKWVTQNEFWRVNILSGKKFRAKYAELAIKMAADKKPKENKFKHPSYFEQDARDQEIAMNKWVAAGHDPEDFVYRP